MESPSPDNAGEPRIVRAIDALNGAVGRAASWLVLAMVLIGAFNAIARYLGRYLGVHLSSNTWLELQWYLFSLVFLLGAAYVLREDRHVRVDVLFGRASARTQAIINIAGTLLLLIPFAAFVIWVSVPIVRSSWQIRELSPDPGGLPRYPLKAMIIVCFVLLLLQAAAGLFRELRRLRRPVHQQPHPPEHV
jgi:TRAP-type mannitol/chloroaromatic compound transport system permease small subunit